MEFSTMTGAPPTRRSVRPSSLRPHRATNSRWQRRIVSGVTSVARAVVDQADTADGEAPAVVLVETQALPGELSLQDAILLAQKRDHVRLFAMEPATQTESMP